MLGKVKQGISYRDVIVDMKYQTVRCPFCGQELEIEIAIIESIIAKKIIRYYKCGRCNMRFPYYNCGGLWIYRIIKKLLDKKRKDDGKSKKNKKQQRI